MPGKKDLTVGGCARSRITLPCERIKITSKEPVFSNLTKLIVPEIISIENILMPVNTCNAKNDSQHPSRWCRQFARRLCDML